MSEPEEPEVAPLAEPTTHTYTNAVGAVTALDVPDGYVPPDVIMMVKTGSPTQAVFTHDEFVPQAFVEPGAPTEPPATP